MRVSTFTKSDDEFLLVKQHRETGQLAVVSLSHEELIKHLKAMWAYTPYTLVSVVRFAEDSDLKL